MKRWICMSLIAFTALYAESVDEALEGFDEGGERVEQQATSSTEDALEGFDDEEDTTETSRQTPLVEGLSGSLSSLIGIGLGTPTPNHALNTAKLSLFLDYEHSFANGWKFKSNAKAYYDPRYDIGDRPYNSEQEDAFGSEVRLYDAYLEGSLSEKLDFKIGRQVVVWGRSDTIRITDLLNPLDNRRPGMVDIEDLRLPVTMAKLDWYLGSWRVTPIAILEQQATLNPPFGSQWYPLNRPMPKDQSYHDVTYALSVGKEANGWDMNLYAARVHQERPTIAQPVTPKSKLSYPKTTMLGTALNLLYGSWLFKGEVAYFSSLHYSTTHDESFARLDSLVGVEYNGFANTMVSYDLSLRHLYDFDSRLAREPFPTEENRWQHALRITKDLYNATLHTNYLISLFGKKLDEGGFQRLWAVYDIDDNLKATVGVVDYIGGSPFFDATKDADLFFMELKYTF